MYAQVLLDLFGLQVRMNDEEEDADSCTRTMEAEINA
jgi:hypothetical protein